MVFAKNKQTNSTSITTIELVTKSLHVIDKNEYTTGVFLDFAKSFDIVDHEILLKKLEHLSIMKFVVLP